jgi:hypothetical protein
MTTEPLAPGLPVDGRDRAEPVRIEGPGSLEVAVSHDDAAGYAGPVVRDPELLERLNLNQLAFLHAYVATGGNVSRAADFAGISRKTHYWWIEHHEHYVDALRDAHGSMCDRLEAEADRRAVDGVLEPVFYKGVEVGTVRKYSDRLLITRLRAEMPEKYADRRFVKSESLVDARFASMHLHADLSGLDPSEMRDELVSRLSAFVDDPESARTVIDTTARENPA